MGRRNRGGRELLFAGLLLGLAALAGPAWATSETAPFASVFPEATRFGPFEGTPPAAPAYSGENLAGYVFHTRDVVASSGFSGKPLDLLVGLDLEGRITGARVLEQNEPILVIGVEPAALDAFVAQYRGLDVREPLRVERRGGGGPGSVDAVSGATISSVVFNDAILRAARAVGRSRGLFGGGAADFHSFAAASWAELLDEGSLVRRVVTVSEAVDLLAEQGARLFPEGAAVPEATAPFLDLTLGLATPARVGRNLVGERLYNRVMGQLSEGDQVIFVAARGLYSFKGTAWVRDGVFDRIQIVQGEHTLRLRKEDHTRIDKLALEDAPELRELAFFSLAKDSGFDPLAPWRLEVSIAGARDGGGEAIAILAFDYSLPARYRPAELGDSERAGMPLWLQVWQARIVDIAVLVLALTVLSGVLVFQDAIAKRRELYQGVRYAFLAFTLIWLGWYAGAQLSVLNVLTFGDALRSKFHWDFFLLEPLLFILWSFVAVALLFWGRGVFCGWLCPFGALQELTNRLARLARVPQIDLPFAVHERLWPIKYMVFLGLFAVALGSMATAQVLAEVEPFKTAIVLKFDRAWPFVLFPLVLLGVGLFVQRFFCRYLCPLGAALAIPARLRMFDWLKRRWQCGTQCHICAVDCPVQAIHPNGQINPNECVHCLLCQVNYFDDQVCPPLIERRKRREKRQAARAEAAAPEPEAS